MKAVWDLKAEVWVAQSQDFPVTTQGRNWEEMNAAFTAAVESYLAAHKGRGTKAVVKVDLNRS